MKKLLAALVTAAMLVLSLSGCSSKTDYSFEGSLKALNSSNDVIGTANDFNAPAEVYTYFFHYYKAVQENELINYGYTESDFASYWNTALEDGETMYDMLQEQALSVTKEFSELLQTVRTKNIVLSDEDAINAAAEIDTQIKSFEAEGMDAKATYEALTGLKVEQMKAMNVLFAYIGAYSTSISEQVSVADEEVEAYYQDNISFYEKATAQHVLIETSETMSPTELEEAQALANEILEMINNGTKTIGELAAEYSADAGSKDSGGEYTFGRGDMVTEFEDWAFNATEGDTGIVNTVYGFHVMRSGGKVTEPLETVSSTIRATLSNIKIDEIMTSDVSSLNLVWTVNEDVLTKINSTLMK